MIGLRSAPLDLGPMPSTSRMAVVDERLVAAPIERIFTLAADVEAWPRHLAHYRYVRFLERDSAGGGLVEMSANRPFGLLDWPTWWTSEMTTRPPGSLAHDLRGPSPAIRFRHVRGVTAGMEVEWRFEPVPTGTHVTIEHLWNGPDWPLIGDLSARAVVGPVFVHGIAARTLAGLARVAEPSAAASEIPLGGRRG